MLGFIFLSILFFFFIILETNPPMLGTLTPPCSPVPQNTSKFWGVSTCPQCAFPRSHAPPSRKLGGTLLIKHRKKFLVLPYFNAWFRKFHQNCRVLSNVLRGSTLRFKVEARAKILGGGQTVLLMSRIPI